MCARAVRDLKIDYPGRDRQRLRDLARLQQPVLAGALLHRCAGPHPPPPFRRRRVRRVRTRHPAAAGRGRRRSGVPTGVVENRGLWCRSRGRCKQRPIAGNLCRLRACRAFRRLPAAPSRMPPRLCPAAVARPQRMGARRQLDGGERAGGARQPGRPHRLSLSRPRPAPGAGPGTGRQARSLPRSARRPAARRRPRRRYRRTTATVSSRSSGSISSMRQQGDIKDRTFEIQFLDPGVQAFAFTFG